MKNFTPPTFGQSLIESPQRHRRLRKVEWALVTLLIVCNVGLLAVVLMR